MSLQNTEYSQENKDNSNNQTNDSGKERNDKTIVLSSSSGSASGTTTVGTAHLEETISKLQEEIRELKQLNINTKAELPQTNLGYQEIKLVVKDKCDTLEERLQEEENMFNFLKEESQKGTINGIIRRNELNSDLANFYFLRQMKERGLFNWDTSKFSYADQKRAVAAAIQSNTWSL